jgi:DNA-binding XRE family transcriptional regulator
MTQEEMANEIGISPKSYNLKENGKNYLGDCVNVFLIAYERDNSKSLTIEIIK